MSGNKKNIEKWFSRYRIATLPMETIDNLYEFSFKSLNFALPQIKLYSRFDDYSLNQLDLHIEILSRLSLRLEKEKLDVLFAIAINLFNNQIILRAHSLHGSLFHLFERIINKIIDLIEVPISQDLS